MVIDATNLKGYEFPMTDWTDPWPRLGGAPLLDALNTIGGPLGDRADNERIRRPVDLTDWAKGAGVFDDGALEAVRGAPDADGEAALTRFRAFRSAAFSVLDAARAQTPAPQPELQALSEVIAQAKERAGLTFEDGRVRWRRYGEVRPADFVTDQLALEADAFLAGEEIERLRRCRRCSWLFLAPRRGRPRVWCSMALCGNRDKQARHQARLRSA